MKTNLLILLLFFIISCSNQKGNNPKEASDTEVETLLEVKKSAEQGVAEAQYTLGFMYYNWDGTLTDKKQAFYWYKKSAEQGNVNAQFTLGIMYSNGDGVLTDKKQAFYWYKKSA